MSMVFTAKLGWRSRVADLARRGWGLIPLSGVGLVALFAIWAAFHYWGKGQTDFVVRAAAVVSVVVLATAVLFVVLVTVLLYWRVSRSSLETVHGDVDVGAALADGIRFPRFRWWPLVQVSMDWRAPDKVTVELKPDGGTYVERVRPGERGRWQSITRRFQVRDIFGLSVMRFDVAAAAQVRAAPARTAADLTPAIRRADGDGFGHPSGEAVGDLVEMRRYGPGDPLRLVLWKAFARSRQLLVRTPERALAPEPSVAAYFVAGPGDEDSASVARTCLESGLLGDEIVFGADGADAPALTIDGAQELLIDSVRQRHAGGGGLAQFLHQIDRAQLGSCVLFLPGEEGAWLPEVEHFVRALPAPPTLLVTTDGRLGRRPGRRERWLRRPDANAPADLSKVPALADRLRRTGAQIMVVHRSSGRVLTAGELEALRPA